MVYYNMHMPTVLDKAIVRVQGLSPAEQALVGGLMLSFVDDRVRSYQLSMQQIEEVKLTQQAVRDGKIASDEEVRALWNKFGVV